MPWVHQVLKGFSYNSSSLRPAVSIDTTYPESSSPGDKKFSQPAMTKRRLSEWNETAARSSKSDRENAMIFSRFATREKYL
jgi:hypothetical protein